jgi:hypothetical protein
MENNDGYIVEIVRKSKPSNNILDINQQPSSTETKYYYKNGKLHRELGPAIVHDNEKEKFLNLGDEHLYEEIYVDNGIGKYKTYFRIEEFRTTIVFFQYIYHLEGKGYSEKEFLEKQLQRELPINHSLSKKNKL